MSLIRALSNPEGMYVFGGCGQPFELYSGRGWHLSNIGPDETDCRGMVVPTRTFYRACRLSDYPMQGDIPVEVNGFKIEEVVIYAKTGRLVPEMTTIPKNYFTARSAERMWAIKLSYKDKYVFMHRVTWEYIRRNALEQEQWERKEARRKRAKKRAKRESSRASRAS